MGHTHTTIAASLVTNNLLIDASQVDVGVGVSGTGSGSGGDAMNNMTCFVPERSVQSQVTCSGICATDGLVRMQPSFCM